jgi:transcription factor SPN1
LYFPTAAKKSRVVCDADDSDSDVVSDKSGKRETTVASDSEEEAGKEESSVKKKEDKDLFGSDSESGNEEE